MTISDFIEQVLAVESIEKARRFLDETVSDLRARGSTDPEADARANIGWCFGEGMRDERRAMWREHFGIVHPWLGPMVERPSPEEILRIGMEMGERQQREHDEPG